MRPLRAVIVAVMLGLLPAAVMAQHGPAQVAVPAGTAAMDAETKCLALTVYWEGRTESRIGQEAIAHTVLNRVGSGKFPATICGVVTESSGPGRGRCQFSWWCDGKRDEPQYPEFWHEAVEVARAAVQGGSTDPTGGALFFHSTRIKPKWGRHRQPLVRIGNHIFYR